MNELSLMATEGSLSGSDKEGEEGAGDMSAPSQPLKGTEKKAKARGKKASAEQEILEAEGFTALLAADDSDESSGEPILAPGKGAAALGGGSKKKDGGEKTPGERKIAVWTQEEKDRFGEMITKQGKKKDWDQLQEAFPNKTLQQLRTHFQNSKAKRLKELEREAALAAEKEKEKEKESNAGGGWLAFLWHRHLCLWQLTYAESRCRSRVTEHLNAQKWLSSRLCCLVCKRPWQALKL